MRVESAGKPQERRIGDLGQPRGCPWSRICCGSGVKIFGGGYS